MADKCAPASPMGIAELAATQYGVVSAPQLYALGLSKAQISSRAKHGWLIAVHRGVYAVGHARLSREGQWMAAVLAGGPGAVLSHENAAALWLIRAPARAGPVDVTLPTRAGRRRRAGIRVHRPRRLPEDEVSVHRDIPCTTPARTVLDLACVLGTRPLERAADEADRLRLVAADDLIELLRRHRWHPGARRLRGVLARHQIGSTVTRSELEERFLDLCRRRHLPQPEMNVPLLDYVVDFLWPEARLVVEVDGQATHGTRRAFQVDRDRDGALTVEGYTVLRFTWFDVTRRPAVVASRVQQLLVGRIA